MSGIDSEVEAAIKAACAVQDFGLATTRAFEAYGSEILSFLMARLRSESDGEEAFSLFSEYLCTALPSFEFRCSVRGYLYTLARHAASRHATARHRRHERNMTGISNAALSQLIDRARSVTQMHKRTDVKDKMRALREQLPEDDQMLIMLHVDRALPWREIALVVHEGSQALDEAATEREAARLRKRFERVKGELRALAEKEGLIKR